MAEQQAAVCRVFANASRIMILWSLADGEQSVSDIAVTLGLSIQSTSQHLGLMKSCGLLESRREGQQIFYRIAANPASLGCQLVEVTRKRSPTSA